MKQAAGLGVGLALAAFSVQWLEQQFALGVLRTEAYVVVLAVAFTLLGIWVGARVGPAAPISEPEQAADSTSHENRTALRDLGITRREFDVLLALSQGSSNAEIASALSVSVSTVKTHLIHLYQKLDVSRRTQAIRRARQLGLIG